MDNENQPRYPKGRYKARAVKGELGHSSQKGTPQIVVEFELLDEQWKGERVHWIGYFTDATTERTMESLRIAGWKTDDLADLAGLGDVEVSLVIEHEKYVDQKTGEEKIRTKVQWVNKSGGFEQKAPMTNDQVRAFAAKMRGAAIASRMKTGGTKPASQGEQQQLGNTGTDDIPF